MRVLVSACLLGRNCKYSGGNNRNERVISFLKDKEVIPVCPEVEAGLPVPRPPVEIRKGRVVRKDGRDMDEIYRLGAARVLSRMGKVDLAILKSGSPTCGVHDIYDGTFSGKKIKGRGVLAEALVRAGVPVMDEKAGKAMEEAILSAQKEGDSVGGVVECMALGLPVGLGDPFFDSLESEMAHMMFSVPAVKAISFGEGFGFASLYGSEANDSLHYEGGTPKALTNHNGGVLGGISSGSPLLFTLAVKPTASIGKRQRTIDISKKEDTDLSIGGRHDPCIIPRAIPVIENAAALVILDLLLTDRRNSHVG